MKRQQTRKALIFISFLLFPITLYYFSPVVIIQGAAHGVITGSFLVFTILLVGSVFLGRSFCGWICPGAGLQEACFSLNSRPARGGRYDWIKYMIWVPWLLAIVYAAWSAGGLNIFDPFYMTKDGISVTNVPGVIALTIVLVLFASAALIGGKRGACHYICWMAPFMIIGTNLRQKLGWSGLSLKAEKSKCINCKLCNKACPMSLDVAGLVNRNSMSDTECILCASCIDTCPKKVIQYSLSK